ncbi:MAG: Na/Pi symporter, partial [Clostridia bacterium]|nr:Na/Pi symporter [Clostridia bacterium]
MDLLQIIYNIFSMLGGLAIFLVGMKFMGNSLETVAGDKMKKMFEKISDNRFKGFAIGTAATAVVQSSSATSVMVIGFVNVGFLTLYQAIPILLGAIVGTTVTAQLTSLS